MVGRAANICVFVWFRGLWKERKECMGMIQPLTSMCQSGICPIANSCMSLGGGVYRELCTTHLFLTLVGRRARTSKRISNAELYLLPLFETATSLASPVLFSCKERHHGSVGG